MRYLAIAIAIAACGPGPTPLYGPTPCESMQCGPGQVCEASRAYPDDGGVPAQCITVPTTCVVYDCSENQCSTCIRELCDVCRTDVDNCYMSLTGRSLRCP